MEKYCQRENCGRLIAREIGGEYYDVIRQRYMSHYAWIRRKYCPDCAEKARREQQLDYVHRKRPLLRKYQEKERERLDMLTRENAFLRQRLVQEGVL